MITFSNGRLKSFNTIWWYVCLIRSRQWPKKRKTRRKTNPVIVCVDWTGEVLCCASPEDYEGFQRPQSLISCPCYQRFILWRGGGQLPWSQRPRARILGIKGWKKCLRSGSDCCRDGVPQGAGVHWTFLWQRGSTKQLPGQCYQGILNGYDMICLASFLIKACWGNLSFAAHWLAGRSSVNADHCLSPSFLERSKFHCDYTKGSGHWPGLLDMLWWGDREANQSSSNHQPTFDYNKNGVLQSSSIVTRVLKDRVFSLWKKIYTSIETYRTVQFFHKGL